MSGEAAPASARGASADTRRAPGAVVFGPLPPPYHGGAIATRYLLRSALRHRLRLHHVDTTDRRDLSNIGRIDYTNVKLALLHFLRFVRVLVSARPKLVYVPVSQNRMAFLRDCLFLVPGRLLRRAIIVHVHGGNLGRFRRETDALTRALMGWVFRGVDRVIVLGERHRAMMDGLVPPERVAVVPNGVKWPGVEGDAVGDAHGDAGVKRVVYLGALARVKGFLDLLEAGKRLIEERPDVEFVFAGAFTRPSDRRAADDAMQGVPAERIRFCGVVEGADKARLLAEAHLFVLPTHLNEGHPYAVLEAMAAALPIVTTGKGGIAESVTDGENGVFVPERDPAALAGAIRGLLDDDARRERLGRASRRRYLEDYTLAAWEERMIEVFEAVVADRAGARSGGRWG